MGGCKHFPLQLKAAEYIATFEEQLLQDVVTVSDNEWSVLQRAAQCQ